MLPVGQRRLGVSDLDPSETAPAIELRVGRLRRDSCFEILQPTVELPGLAPSQSAKESQIRAISQSYRPIEIGNAHSKFSKIDVIDPTCLPILWSIWSLCNSVIDMLDLRLPGHAGLFASESLNVLAFRRIKGTTGSCEREDRSDRPNHPNLHNAVQTCLPPFIEASVYIRGYVLQPRTKRA